MRDAATRLAVAAARVLCLCLRETLPLRLGCFSRIVNDFLQHVACNREERLLHIDVVLGASLEKFNSVLIRKRLAARRFDFLNKSKVHELTLTLRSTISHLLPMIIFCTFSAACCSI